MTYEWKRLDNGDDRRMRGLCEITLWGSSRSALVSRRVDGVTYLTRCQLRYGRDDAAFDAACDADADAINAMADRLASPCCGGCAEVGK